MVFEIILITVTIIALLGASYIDIRTREVPDLLNYGLIFVGLGLRAIFSLEFGWGVLVSGMFGFLICFVVACFFYYTRQWGGGDSKLLMGMGAIIGISFPFTSSSWNLLWFFLALLFLGAIYGLIWMFIVAVKKWKVFSHWFVKSIKKQKKLHVFATVLSLVFLGLVFVNVSFLPLAIAPLGFFYLFSVVSVIENSCFLKWTKVKDLTLGDWLAQPVIVNGKKIINKKTLEKKDLAKLWKLDSEGAANKVLIKEGIPLVPSFLFAYLFLLFGQDFVRWAAGGIL